MSLTPGALSMPDDTSTPRAPVTAIASATFWGSSPPDSSHGRRGAKPCGKAPVEGDAVAARQDGGLRRLGVDQQAVDKGLVSGRGREILARGDADRLHRLAAVGRRDGADPLRALPAM